MCDFDIQQLRYFVEAARTHSMAQAARRLYVSPQGLSKGIRRLEENLGRDLFVRGTAGVELTAFGEFFLRRAEKAVDAFALAERSCTDFEASERRTIAVAMPAECTADFGGTLNAAKIRELQQAFPTVAFEFRTEGKETIERQLQNGEIQFAIGSPMEEDGYCTRLLDAFPLVVAVRRQNGLALRPRLTPADLAGGRVMAPGAEAELERMMQRAGYPETVTEPVIKLSPIDISELVIDPNTFVVRPEQHARRTTSLDHVALVPLADANGQPIEAQLCLSWRSKMRIAGPERALIDFLAETYANR